MSSFRLKKHNLDSQSQKNSMRKNNMFPTSMFPTSILATIMIVVVMISVVIFFGTINDQKIHTYLDKSVPFVGIDTPRLDGIDGEGIFIAVIDTGVNYEHPDMLGWMSDGKVAGGYNLLWDADTPIDTDGHGTQVAGVISADGQLKGVAPKSKILAYKVSEDGENVSSDLIAQAVTRAVDDGADIINISMGITHTNTVIENAINDALAQGVLVVVAAGNAGPQQSTIGSPGRSSGSLTVGATYNNLTSSMIATLDVDDVYSYTVIPMVGTNSLSSPIQSQMIFAGYAKESDFIDIDVKDLIVIAERGSDVPDELLYFSLKEKHAADAGAAALIVFNNVDGMFLGELIHEFIESGYSPRIPVVSMDRDEGLELLELVNNATVTTASLNLFHNPDYVAHFSSRGPVSPFYIKPDLMAPGTYINTTHTGSLYNITSGTSYAAPHVSGAAALLLQKNPDLDRHEIKSIIMTTTDPVSDSYGDLLSVHDTGSGRLNIMRAYEADVAILPPSFVVMMSEQSKVAEQRFEMRFISSDTDEIASYFDDDNNNNDNNDNDRGNSGSDNDNIHDKLSVMFKGPDFVEFSYLLDENFVLTKMSISQDVINKTNTLVDSNATENYVVSGDNVTRDNVTRDNVTRDNVTSNNFQYDQILPDTYEGRIIFDLNGSTYTVPFLLHYTRGSISTTVTYDTSDNIGDNIGNNIGNNTSHNNTTTRYLSFNVSHPDGWEFAKIDVIDSVTEETVTVSATKDTHDEPTIKVQKDSTYWIDATITSNGESYHAYDVVHVGLDSLNGSMSDTFDTLWLKHNSEQQNAFTISELLPMRHIIILIVVAVAISVTGVVIKMRNKDVDLLR